MSRKVLTIQAAILVLLVLSLWIPTLGLGQQSVGRGWGTDTVSSHSLGRRAIYIVTPEGYNNGTSRYPLVIMLDANDELMFRLWIAQAAYLEGNSAGLPSVMAVGIPNGNDRIHDMTPPATGSSVKEFPNAGGAAAFADFIVDEVLPYVRARYRTLPSTTLTGHSAGGLFALDVAAHRPTAFNAIIATSPAIWYDDQTLVPIYADLLGRASTHPRIFFSSGGDEGDIDAACKRLNELLSAKESMKGSFSYRTYPDETHTLTPMSFADGFRFVFDPVSTDHFAIEHLDFEKLDETALNNAINSSENAVAAAARLLGLSEQLPEQALNRLGYRLLSHKKAPLAIPVFKRNVLLYPKSVNVYDSLGDGFLAAADTASALAQFQMAVKVAKEAGAPVPAETEQKLHALEARRK